jgi:pilus assembly protein CpaF
MDGKRRITSVTEIVGMEGDVLTMQEIFKFQQETIDREGKVHGSFVSCGVRPRCMPRLEADGVRLPANLFQQKILAKVG